MQSKSTFIGLAVLLFCIPVLGADSGPITHLDTTKGNPGHHMITYVTIVEADKSRQKTVAVFLIHSEEQDLVYRYHVKGKSVTLELVAEASFAIPKKDDPDFTMTVVHVTEAQYEKSKEIIEEHIEKTILSETPEIRFYNCISEVLAACGMRIPYRSRYRPPNLVQWVGDIPAYSRDIVFKD
jgi:hypothetical protein